MVMTISRMLDRQMLYQNRLRNEALSEISHQ